MFTQGNQYANNLTGGSAGDSIYGNGGNDRLSGGGGADVLDGGDGRDTINGGSGNDTITGGAGSDSLNGGTGSDSVDGGTGNDTINGGVGDGADYLWGQEGNDVIYGGAGADHIYGGVGNDHLSGQDGNDYINGDTGYDLLTGGNGDDTLIALGGGYHGAAYGGAGVDNVYVVDGRADGGADNDWVGTRLQDQDNLVFSANATLSGGDGADQFSTQAVDDGLKGTAKILDFHLDQGDTLHIGVDSWDPVNNVPVTLTGADVAARLDVNGDGVIGVYGDANADFYDPNWHVDRIWSSDADGVEHVGVQLTVAGDAIQVMDHSTVDFMIG